MADADMHACRHCCETSIQQYHCWWFWGTACWRGGREGSKGAEWKREAGGYINRIGVVIDYFNAKRGKILLTDLVNESLGIIHFLYFCQFVSKLSILSTRSCKRCSYYLIRLRFSHLVKVNKMSYERDDEAPTDSLYPIAHPFATSTNQSSLLKHHPTAFVDCSDPTSFLQER